MKCKPRIFYSNSFALLFIKEKNNITKYFKFLEIRDPKVDIFHQICSFFMPLHFMTLIILGTKNGVPSKKAKWGGGIKMLVPNAF